MERPPETCLFKVLLQDLATPCLKDWLLWEFSCVSMKTGGTRSGIDRVFLVFLRGSPQA